MRFETCEMFISLILQFFSGRGKPRILNQRILDQWIRGYDCIYVYLLVHISNKPTAALPYVTAVITHTHTHTHTRNLGF
jgi:hypothetical protein